VTEHSARTTAATARPSLPVGLVAACRPKQWAKNVLVFVAPAAAGVLDTPYYVRLTLQGFVAFCMVSSATYLLNDVLDVDSDRRHPTTRHRPIASGVVPVPLALGMSVVLFAAGVALAAWTSWPLAVVVAGYAVLTTSYSMVLKRIAVMDLVILSAGFILRLLGGAYAAGVDVSEWFLLVSLFGSLFIASAKRFAEKKELGIEAAELRPTLGAYSIEYLGLVRTAAAAAVMMSYCQWAVESGNSDRFATPWVQLSIVPFVIAILRYALLVDQGQGAAPEEVLTEDRQLQLMGVLLVTCLFLAVYV
jgi:decaprenyl-phosphate phosphoribosyltransferase